MSLAVITSVYGKHDTVPEPLAQDIEADWIIVTDDPDCCITRTWRGILEPRPHLHPRMAAKVAKCRPDLYTDADVTVWVDGSFRFLTEHTLRDLVEASDGHRLSQIVHPWRDCIYDEAEASIGMPKYEGQPIAEQVRWYERELNHPQHWGLWATGLIVRNRSTSPYLQAFGTAWLAEQSRWTYQDQLSEAVVLRQMDHWLPHELPWPLHGSGLYEWAEHAHIY